MAKETANSGWKSPVGRLVRKSTVAATYDALRQIAAVFQRRGSLRQITTFCDKLDSPDRCEEATKTR